MTKRELVASCNQLRSHLRARGYASDQELADIWPARQNARKDDWWSCRCQLLRFMGRAEWLYSRSPEAEQEVLATLRDEPVPLHLLTGHRVQVYPKSFDALLWFRSMDFALEFIWLRTETLKYGMESGEIVPGDYDPQELIQRGDSEVSRILRVLATAACQEGLGVDPEAAEVAGPPFDDLESIDLIRIHKTFVDVNATRLGLAQTILPHKTGGNGSGPLSWNVFFSSMARNLKEDVRDLMRDRSLASLLTQVHLAAPTGLE